MARLCAACDDWISLTVAGRAKKGPRSGVFRLEVPVPASFRVDDQAPRVLANLERTLQDVGASTHRRGTTLEFTGGLVRRGGRGSVSWREGTTKAGPRFVLRGAVWPEVGMIVGLGVLFATLLGWGSGGAVRVVGSVVLATVLMGVCPVLVAGCQMMWLRRKLAADIARVTA